MGIFAAGNIFSSSQFYIYTLYKIKVQKGGFSEQFLKEPHNVKNILKFPCG